MTRHIRGLYAILDFETIEREGLDLLRLADAIGSASPTLVQLRAKRSKKSEIARLLAALRPHVAPDKLVVNDHWELAHEGLADLAHVGQGDTPTAAIRNDAKELPFGISTHDLQELERALKERPAYVALGPIFETGTKRNPEKTVGVNLLAEAHARSRVAGIPLVAIGGITEENVAAVAPYCDAVAMVAPLHLSDYREVAARAARIHRAAGGE